MKSRAEIDRVFQQAVETAQVPFALGVALSAEGILYESAVGPGIGLDSIFWIASMTKPLTTLAALQLVEQGKLDLDRPAAEVAPQLAEIPVLEGFDAAGKPRLRPARHSVTLRQLLTHTSGFCYEAQSVDSLRYIREAGLPPPRSCKMKVFETPLMFDPGERWEYGIGIDWAGRLVELAAGKTLDRYFVDHIFGPLGMIDTGYKPPPEKLSRVALMHARIAGAGLTPMPRQFPEPMEFAPGGGGLTSTGRDYARFLRMFMNGGTLEGIRLLKPETIALMSQNHIGDLKAGFMRSAAPHATAVTEFFPGIPKKWTLGFMLNEAEVPGRRSAGSLGWAGVGNTFFWIDRKRKIAGIFMTQVTPFCDPGVLATLDAFEAAVSADA